MYARMAITTKYLGPTNFRPSRIAAKCEAGRIVVVWDGALGIADNHAAAVRALAVKLGWGGTWRLGSIASGSYVAVMDTDANALQVDVTDA